MKRGILLKIQGKTAIVLTPDGEFLRAPADREGWWPGQEVTWSEREPRAGWRPAVALACVLVLLLAGSGLAYRHWWALGPVVAYVSVDINPSLELGVDARERVCSARAFNPEGERLLAGLAYRHRNLGETLSDLTVRALEQGYLGADRPGAVLVAVAPSGTTAKVDPARLREKAVNATRQVLEERGLKVEVKGWTTDRQVHEEARRLHMSAGRMALYLVARRAGAEVTLEQVRREPIARVLSLVTDHPGRREPGTPQQEGESAQGEGPHGKGDGSPAVPGNKPHSPAEEETRSRHGSSPSGKPVPGLGESRARAPGSGEERARGPGSGESRAPGESAPALDSGPGTVSPPPPEQASEETPADEDDSGTQVTQPPLHPETQPDDDGQTAVRLETRPENSEEEAEEPPHPSDLLPPESGEEEGR